MNPKRGQLFLLKPDPDGKERPIVIVSVDVLNGGHKVLAVPFYSQQLDKRKDQDWCALFSKSEGGLDRDCVAKCDEITLLDKLEINFSRPLGHFNASEMDRLMDSLKWSLGLD